MAYVKIWNAVLTPEEMAQERWTALPRRTNDLFGFYPLSGQYYEKCFLGVGPTWDPYGATQPSADIDPPVSWGTTESGLYVPLGKQLYEVLDEAILDNNDYAQLSL